MMLPVSRRRLVAALLLAVLAAGPESAPAQPVPDPTTQVDLKVLPEKYDLVQRASHVSAGIEYGYSENVIGFGWTNAVVLRLLRNVHR